MDNQPLKIKEFFTKPRLIALGIIIILIVEIFWYLASHKPEITEEIPLRPTADTNQEPESATAYAQVDSLNTMSTSDELGAIEADLESTNLDSLTREMNAIQAELGSSR